MEEKFKFPTEQIDLPSKGLIYPESSPLSKGVIEMKYMTAKEEDILSNANFIRQGTVIDKLLQSMIVTPDIDYNMLLNGDKNAILIAARILGYGKDYDFLYTDPINGRAEKVSVDLTTLESKQIDESLFTKGKNEFNFQLPFSKITVTFRLLTHGDEKKIDKEIKGLEKINANGSYDITTRLKYTIIAINGNGDVATVREFCENMLARDVKALREHMVKIMPDVDMKVNVTKSNGDVVEGIDLPMVLAFFGLTPEYKKVVLDEILLLCYHSQGGFTHDEVYNMPVRYRHYYIQKLSELLQKQQDEIDKKFNNNKGTELAQPNKKIKEQPPIPDFAFKARAPKK